MQQKESAARQALRKKRARRRAIRLAGAAALAAALGALTVCVILPGMDGGQGADEAYTEASVMAKYLTARGVDESRVLLEEQASDTRENLEFSRTLAQTHGMRTDRVLIITSDFHLCRAKYLARKLGMEPYGLASQTWPEILRVNYLLREVFAFIKAAM